MDNGGAILGGGSGARFLFFWLYDIVLTGLAALLTAYFSPGVEGSGIPVRLICTVHRLMYEVCFRSMIYDLLVLDSVVFSRGRKIYK